MEQSKTNDNIKHNYKILFFGYNMYGKLTNHVFTKIVVKKGDYYKLNDIYQIKLMSLDLSFCRLVALKELLYYDLTDFESYIDLGFCIQDYRKYLLDLLPSDFDLKKDKLLFCVFEKINPLAV